MANNTQTIDTDTLEDLQIYMDSKRRLICEPNTPENLERIRKRFKMAKVHLRGVFIKVPPLRFVDLEMRAVEINNGVIDKLIDNG